MSRDLDWETIWFSFATNLLEVFCGSGPLTKHLYFLGKEIHRLSFHSSSIPNRQLLDRSISKSPPLSSKVLPLDTLSKKERSARMSLIRGSGNESTEQKAVANLVRSGIHGWRRHDRTILGRPDISFRKERVAVFLDGCFWHGCRHCGRIPKSKLDFWLPKIEGNIRRDSAVCRALKRQGFLVLRIWEHDLGDDGWLIRVIKALDTSNAR
jgi:DNA mismatch endonuclease (patch repair protein)